jgi:FKBP-type peptidyl-prolyl cis-trans isomerase
MVETMSEVEDREDAGTDEAQAGEGTRAEQAEAAPQTQAEDTSKTGKAGEKGKTGAGDDADVADDAGTLDDADTAGGEQDDGEVGARGNDDAQRPKVKMPQAKEISRSDFTPHALGAKGRPAPRSGTRAAAKRRRILYTVGGVVVVAALAAGMVAYANRPKPSVKVKGAFGKAPAVSVPKAKPAPKKEVKELIHGTGATVGKSDFVVAHLVGYTWASNGGKELLNTYRKGQPAAGSASQLTGLAALDKEIAGRKAGTRLKLTLPYGDVGAEVAQSLKLTKTQDLVMTVDLISTFGKTATARGTAQKPDPKLPAVTPGAPGAAPTVKIPSGAAPSKLQVSTLIQGTGPVVKKGQTLVAQYDGVLWRTGKVFDSSYQHGAPAGFPIGVKQVIPAWDTALVGKNAGSRVLMVVPPKDGYGAQGSPDGTIKGTDTLVFVVDILGSF